MSRGGGGFATRGIGGYPGAVLALQRAAGNAAVARLLQRQVKFCTQPPTTQEKAAGEAAVRAENARSAPLVSAARGKFDAKANELVGGAKPNWAKLKLDTVPKDVSAEEAPKFAEISEADVRAAFENAWSSVFGQPIPGEVLSRLVGQWKAEGGKKGIADYNIGNLTYPTDPATGKPKDPVSDYRKRTAGENQPSGAKVPRTAFYAVFKDLEQGAMAMLHRLVVGPNGGLALLAALIYGTVEEYVFVAKSSNYFTAPVRNVTITDRNGEQVIWQSGYLDGLKFNKPKITVPPIPPPMPVGSEAPGQEPSPDEPPQQPYGPPAPPAEAPAEAPPPASSPDDEATGTPGVSPGARPGPEGGMSGDTGTD